MFNVIAIVILVAVLSISAFAHSLQSWANMYTPSNAITNNVFQFTILFAHHMNGKNVNYYWTNYTARTHFETAVVNAFNSSWSGMISGTETTSANAHLRISYDVITPPPSYAGIRINHGGDANYHYRQGIQSHGSTDAEIIFYNDTASYSSTDKQRIAAHELGHLWGIGDLYNHPNGGNLESIYSQPYAYATATRHDKNAMYIGLNDPWFQNWDGKWWYQKSPGVWAYNEWIKNYYYFNSSGNWVDNSLPCAQTCWSAQETCIPLQENLCQSDCIQQMYDTCDYNNNMSGCYNWAMSCIAGCTNQANSYCRSLSAQCMDLCSF